ncbi:MAG: ABC transporter permease [Luteolibacter sp.]
MIKDLWLSRGLGWRLARRNIEALYRSSFLGYLWMIIPPLFSAGVFIALRSEGVFSAPSSGKDYAAFALCGLLLWQCFADGLLAPLRCLRQCLSLLPKLRVAGEALLLAALFDSLIQAAIRILIITVVLCIFRIPPGVEIALLPIAVGALVLVGFSFGILLAPFAAIVADLERGLTLLLPLWMLVSGVVVAEPTTGWMGGILAWNPVSPVLEWARSCVLNTASADFWQVLAATSACGALTVISWILYRLTLPHMVARIPA